MKPEDIVLEIKNVQEALEDIQGELEELPSGENVASADTALILALTALDHAIAELEEMAGIAGDE